MRRGPLGLVNEFINPRVRRYGFWKLISQLFRPEPPRSGVMAVVTAFLDAPVYRLMQSRDVIRPRQRNANFLQKFISGVNEFLNAYTHFADLFARRYIELEVPSDAFQNALEKLVGSSRLRIDRLTDKLLSGRISPNEYFALMVGEVKRINVAAAMLGIRGLGNITPDALTAITDRTYQQIQKLQQFMLDTYGPNFTQPLNLAKLSEAQFRAYAGRFASAGRASSTVAQAALMESLMGAGIETGGNMYMRRIARDDDRSCGDCVAYAEAGWVRADGGQTLPPPGVDCACTDNCRCLLEYCLSYFGNECPDEY